jgi:hypothetical protein
MPQEEANNMLNFIERRCLDLAQQISKNYMTKPTAQKEIAYMIICIARKENFIRDADNPLLRKLYGVTISNPAEFKSTMERVAQECPNKANVLEFDLAVREYDESGQEIRVMPPAPPGARVAPTGPGGIPKQHEARRAGRQPQSRVAQAGRSMSNSRNFEGSRRVIGMKKPPMLVGGARRFNHSREPNRVRIPEKRNISIDVLKNLKNKARGFGGIGEEFSLVQPNRRKSNRVKVPEPRRIFGSGESSLKSRGLGLITRNSRVGSQRNLEVRKLGSGNKLITAEQEKELLRGSRLVYSTKNGQKMVESARKGTVPFNPFNTISNSQANTLLRGSRRVVAQPLHPKNQLSLKTGKMEMLGLKKIDRNMAQKIMSNKAKRTIEARPKIAITQPTKPDPLNTSATQLNFYSSSTPKNQEIKKLKPSNNNLEASGIVTSKPIHISSSKPNPSNFFSQKSHTTDNFYSSNNKPQPTNFFKKTGSPNLVKAHNNVISSGGTNTFRKIEAKNFVTSNKLSNNPFNAKSTRTTNLSSSSLEAPFGAKHYSSNTGHINVGQPRPVTYASKVPRPRTSSGPVQTWNKPADTQLRRSDFGAVMGGFRQPNLSAEQMRGLGMFNPGYQSVGQSAVHGFRSVGTVGRPGQNLSRSFGQNGLSIGLRRQGGIAFRK